MKFSISFSKTFSYVALWVLPQVLKARFVESELRKFCLNVKFLLIWNQIMIMGLDSNATSRLELGLIYNFQMSQTSVSPPNPLLLHYLQWVNVDTLSVNIVQ